MNRIFTVGCFAMAMALSLGACRSGSNTTYPGPGRPPAEPPTEVPTADGLDCSTLRFEQGSTVDALPGGIWTS